MEAGWLHYQPGTKHIAGRYWVTFASGYCFQDEYSTSAELNQQSSSISAESTQQNGSTSAELNTDQHLHRPVTSTSTDTSTDTSFKPNPNPNPKPKPKVKDAEKSAEFFNAFWDAYPSGRKTGKKTAEAAFTKAVKGGASATEIVRAAKEYATSDVAQGMYVKAPTTWLEAGCWDDERTAWQDRKKQVEPCVGLLSMQEKL